MSRIQRQDTRRDGRRPAGLALARLLVRLFEAADPLTELSAKRLPELAKPLAGSARDIRQALRPKHEQRDQADEQQVQRILDAHHCQERSAYAASAAAEEITLQVVAINKTMQERTYPPPAASEPFWPAQATILLAIALQLLLPSRVTVGPRWLIPALEGALLVGMFLATPHELEGEHPVRRATAITLTALVSAANAYSLFALAEHLLHHSVTNGRELIVAGVLIWLTNFLIFGLWYWEIDRGGPGRRAAGRDGPPDFLFPQMSDDTVEPRDWRPAFLDYLYVSLTNATAFSPTDTMPLSRAAKSVMGAQALVSLVTIGLVVSRAVNIL